MRPVGVAPPGPSWVDVLDELEAHVQVAWGLLGDGLPPDPRGVASWAPPASLGPCPPDLHARALAVLRSQSALEEGLARRMEAVSREAEGQAAPRRPAVVAGPRTRFVDQRA